MPFFQDLLLLLHFLVLFNRYIFFLIYNDNILLVLAHAKTNVYFYFYSIEIMIPKATVKSWKNVVQNVQAGTSTNWSFSSNTCSEANITWNKYVAISKMEGTFNGPYSVVYNHYRSDLRCKHISFWTTLPGLYKYTRIYRPHIKKYGSLEKAPFIYANKNSQITLRVRVSLLMAYLST